MEWKQPDGRVIALRVFGDEFYARTATAEGYTVIFNPADLTYYYARRRADDGSLESSGIPVGRPIPRGIFRNLEDAPEKEAAIRTANRKILAPDGDKRWMARIAEAKDDARWGKRDGPPTPAQEQIACLAIPVQFPDDPATLAADPLNFPTDHAKVTRYFNEAGYNDDENTGSIRDYYLDQSVDRVSVNHLVAPIVTLPWPRARYNYADYPANTVLRFTGETGVMLMSDTIAALLVAGFDFSSLSLDSDHRVRATSILFAGQTSGVWLRGLWPHQSAVPDINVGTIGSPIFISRYQISDAPQAEMVIGTVLHELGHLVFGFPDLYDYGNQSYGLGGHCLMALGNYQNSGRTPAPINLYLKSRVGWTDIVDLSPGQEYLATLASTGNQGIKIVNPARSQEFFVIENRGDGDKWAASAPDRGIAIWHVDEAVFTNDNEQGTEAQHYHVALEQADGLFELEKGQNGGGDSTDLFDAGDPDFNDGTLPDAFWWNAVPSGISIEVLSPPGASMDLRFGSGIDLALALDGPPISWTSGGSAPWTGQSATRHDGRDAGMSGPAGNGGTSWVETSVTGPGVLSFRWKVSSEAAADLLSFSVDAASHPSVPAISGEVGWAWRILSIPAGNHVLRWSYGKNSSISAGSDRGWLDEVRFVSGPVADVWVSTVADEAGASLDPALGTGTSLREALTHAPVGATIGFLPDLAGETMLPGGTLPVSKSATLRGPVGGITISGSGLRRVFDISAAATVKMSDLTVAGGSVTGNGAGIRNAGSLELEHCEIESSSATGDGGAIQSSGPLVLKNCGFQDNHAGDDGGAVFSSGNVTMSSCHFASNDCDGSGGGFSAMGGTLSFQQSGFDDNDADQGGGGIHTDHSTMTLSACDVSGNRSHGSDGGGAIHSDNGGSLTMDHCSVAGNVASLRAGGIENDGTLSLLACTLSGNTTGSDGGAIEHVAGILTLTSCTLSGNSANVGGGIDGDGSSTIRLYSSTISANHATDKGGGLEETTGTLLLENSIVAGNTAGNSGADLKASSINTQGGVNLISSTEGLGGSFAGIVASPGLSPLGDHGGPTLTHHPLAESPAIDAGGTTALTVDQRGLPRIAGLAVDIGSVELQPGGLVTSLANAGPGSLRDTLALVPAGSTVTFDASLSGGTIDLTGSPLSITRNLSIDASDSPGLILSGGGSMPIFIIGEGVTASIKGLVMKDGNDSTGGAIQNAGDLSLDSCEIHDCFADEGAGIFNATGATLHLLGGNIHHNFAFFNGGGVLNEGTVTMEGARIANNGAGAEEGGVGGGIASGGPLELTRTMVISNNAQYGGAIFSSGSLEMNACGVEGNNTWDSGGGIFVTGAGGSLDACTLSGNECAGAGGGIWHGSGLLLLVNCTLQGNAADADFGGGISSEGGLEIVSSTLADNDASEAGGGIHVAEGGSVSLCNSIVSGNRAGSTGADLYGALGSQTGVNLLGTIDGVEGSFAGLIGEARLSPLGDFGGFTKVMLPLPGSPLIEAGLAVPATPATDQRGAPRPSGPLPDIGAVEAVALGTLELADTDSDGVPDLLEPAFDMSVGEDDSAVDRDGDASTDAEEIGSMTNPLDPASYLRITGFAPVSGLLFKVSFPTFPGLSYAVEMDGNLDFAGPDFQTVAGFVATGFVTELEIPLRPGADFLRVRRY